MSRWYSANVLQTMPGGRRLWHFSTKGDRFVFGNEKTLLLREPAPAADAAKNWQSYFRPKLNVVWLPLDKVFLRAVQLPGADAAEIASMVELQLEKLSPLPVTHIVWSLYLMPPLEGKPDALRTVIVIIAARSYVEEFLGELEGQGFLADRIECPGLDQLLSAKMTEDGLWFFPGTAGEPALLAWHYGGTVQNLALLPLPEGADRAAQLKAHIEQIAWAGEMEGWLTGPPRIHLVARPGEAEAWKALFAAWADSGVDVIPTPAPAELAAASAQRTGNNGATTNLLPVEYSSRYRQQVVDLLWMRILTAVLGVYLLFVLGYFAALYGLKTINDRTHSELAGLAQSFTNAQNHETEIKLLTDRENLKYASLDCWKAVAENLPATLTLDTFFFNGGSGRLSLSGSASTDQPDDIYTFNEALRQAEDPGHARVLFSAVDPAVTHMQGNKTVWSFNCTLKIRENQNP